MAIDTAEKRKSLSGVIPVLPVGVTPNASQDIEWRQEAGWGYPGIAPGAAAVIEHEFKGKRRIKTPKAGGRSKTVTVAK